jgi:hypothetical protein
MERQTHNNPFTKERYKEKDLVVGNTLYIKRYAFKLIEMDEYTKNYMIVIIKIIIYNNKGQRRDI